MRWYPKRVRMHHIQAMQAWGQVFPDLCLVCKTRSGERHTLTVADILGGEGYDGTVEAAVCPACLAELLEGTRRVVTGREVKE